MGYRSDVTIGVTKVLYTKAVLLENIPNALKNVTKLETTHSVYWQIEGWKWYDSYPEVMDIIEWFNWCFDETENDDSYETTYGAMRLGEEYGDIEEWGHPSDFDIYSSQYISSPFS